MRSEVLYQLSSPQHAVWLDQSLAPSLPCCNIGVVVQVDGVLDLARFEAAIAHVAQTNDALRIVLEQGADDCRQRFSGAAGQWLQRFDFSQLDDAHGQAWAHVKQVFGTPFDVYGPRLWCMHWIDVAPGQAFWLFCFHHLVADGMSISLIGNAVVDAYNRLMRGEALATQDEDASYRDFVTRDGEYFASPRHDKDRDFWAERFARLPEPLFQASARKARSDQPCGQVVWQLDRQAYARLSKVAAAEGGSSTNFLMAVLAAYFARVFQRSDEVVIGMPVHNRTGAAQRRTIGMFSSAIPVGIAVDPEQPFTRILQDVAAELKRCYRHQRYPLAEIHRRLLAGASDRRGLFDVALSVEGFIGDLRFDGDVRTTVHPLHNGYERQPLGIYVRDYEQEKPVYIEFNFDPDVLTPEEMGNHVRRIERLTLAAIAAPSTLVRDLPAMDDAELALVTASFNDTARDYGADTLVHQLFERQVAATPDAVALEFDGQRLRYAELNARANRLALHLRELGVQPDDRVAVCLERGLDLVVAIVAALKAGAAYVPLDPVLPDERLAHMLRDSAPVALLTQSQLRSRLALPEGVTCAELDAPAPWSDYPADDLPAGAQTPAHLAYVIYTSGSTGQPKGVCMPHRALVNLLRWQRDDLPLPARTLQFAALGFDVAFQEIFSTLTSGGTLVLVSEAVRQDLPALADWMRGQDLQRVYLPYIALNGLAELWSQQERPLPALQDLITAGEQLRITPAIRHLFRQAPQARLHNHYGPTESHVVTAHVLASPADEWEDLPPIGAPIANSRIYLLDGHGQPVPLGVTGEIHIGGVQVARAYLGRPDLSAERFLADPFVEGGRLYRTGDLGRWRADGTIEYLGRNDFQVKIRGYRIELGEIETQLARIAGVREAAVLAREDVPGEKRLVAYVVMEEGAQPDPAAWRDRLGQALPEYMLPAAFVPLEALPQTPNGKLDRKALPAPSGQAFVQRAYEATIGAIETTLAQIWSELLGVERVGRHDNFFELGGHSLLAVRLVSQLRERLGIELPLSVLFTHPRLADLALDVAQAGQQTLSAIGRADRSAPLPLSLAQQRLWFIARVDARASKAYHVPDAVRLRGPLDKAALKGALDRIVERHEVLRTRFVGIGGQVRQVIDEPRGFALVQQDLAGAGMAEVERIGREEASLPFDLALGPLIRGRLLRLTDEDHVLLVTTHHIISDGWSAGVLAQEFSTLYEAFHAGRSDPLPPLPIQYADFGVWQRQWLQGPLLQQQLQQWVEQLRGAPALLAVPTDRPRPPMQDYRGANVAIELDSALTEGLKALSQRHGTTMYMTLVAAWAAVLSRLSGQEQVVIGSSHAGRNRVEVEPLIGFFINTQALKMDLAGRPSVHALLAQAKRMAVQAQSLQDVPFERLVEALNPPRSLSYHPVFQVMLSWHNTPKVQLGLPGLTAEAMANAPDFAQFDLSLELHEVDDRIGGQLNYATALFDESTIRRHWGYVHAMLRAMVADDSQQVDRIDLLDTAERRLVLETFNETPATPAQGGLIHALFERHAAAQPDTTAIVCAGGALSYRELNARANQLARHLRGLGVGPDARVAICAERSLEMVVALLATLKAGGACVPLDPVHPDERLAHMLQDSAPVAVLAQAALRARLAVPPASACVLLDETPWQQAAWGAAPVDDLDAGAVGVTDAHLAYVIYTSGSTGTPKGVMVEHRNVLTFLHGLEACIHGVAPDCRRIAWNSSFGFDMAVKAWGQLALGRTVFLLPEETRLDGAALLDFIERHRIEAMECTPSHLRLLQGAGFLKGRAATLRKLLLGGEPIDAATWRELAAVEDTLFFNMYGPTECSVDATCGLIDGRTPHIGHVMPGARVYLLDEERQPVPIGVAGEIHIGGAGVARGYLDRPELTAERFLHDPFAGAAQGRMYRTGDLGRWRADGTIEYLGRNDFQVKLRGFRIELGEIEAQLAREDGVREAVVIAREDTPGDKRLVAYVVARQSAAAPDPALLRARLAGRLPDYMVPSAFVPLEALPLTANGKLDRKALPAPEGQGLAQQAYEAPQGEVEQMIAALWAELLGVERVGRHDNFFDLGGYSLMVFQVIEGLKQKGYNAALQDVLLAQELSALAQLITANNGGAPASSQWVTIRRGGTRPPLVFIHEPSGEVLSYERLARHIDDEVGLYGIRADRAAVTAQTTYEQLAESYVRILREALPQGPYRLAGWSAGGVLAYEVARQLVAQGQEVQFVGLIDSWLRGTAGATAGAIGLADKLMLLASYIEYQGYQLADAETAQLMAAADLPAALDLARGQRWLGKDIDAADFEARIALAYHLRQAAHAYAAQPVDAPVHLFTADPREAADPANGWGTVLRGRLQVYPIGGDHWSLMMEPARAGRLGGAMAAVLAGIDGTVTLAEPALHPAAVIVRTGSARGRKVFCIPGAGANATSFLDLCGGFDAGVTVIGLEAETLLGRDGPVPTVPEAAARYVAAIRAVQPAGPYHLAGHSFGGWIALEAARQLLQAGAVVAPVVLIDTEAPRAQGHASRAQALRQYIRLVEQGGGASLHIDAADLARRDEAAQVLLVCERMKEAGLLPARARAADLEPVIAMFCRQCTIGYRHEQPSGADVLLFVAPSGDAGDAVDVPAWRQLEPGLAVVNVAGSDHLSILKPPHVAIVATEILKHWYLG